MVPLVLVVLLALVIPLGLVVPLVFVVSSGFSWFFVVLVVLVVPLVLRGSCGWLFCCTSSQISVDWQKMCEPWSERQRVKSKRMLEDERDTKN